MQVTGRERLWLSRPGFPSYIVFSAPIPPIQGSEEREAHRQTGIRRIGCLLRLCKRF